MNYQNCVVVEDWQISYQRHLLRSRAEAATMCRVASWDLHRSEIHSCWRVRSTRGKTADRLTTGGTCWRGKQCSVGTVWCGVPAGQWHFEALAEDSDGSAASGHSFIDDGTWEF